MARMFCLSGEYFHTIDAKGRLFMPAKLRVQLGAGFYVCKWRENRLSVYSADDFQALAEKLNAMPVAKSEPLRKLIFPSATDCEVDSQGRILIPQALRRHAGLQKNAAIVGMGNHVAIWAQEQYETLAGQDEQSLEEAMRELQF